MQAVRRENSKLGIESRKTYSRKRTGRYVNCNGGGTFGGEVSVYCEEEVIWCVRVF